MTKPKRPSDPIQRAFQIAQIATGEQTEKKKAAKKKAAKKKSNKNQRSS